MDSLLQETMKRPYQVILGCTLDGEALIEVLS